MMLTLISRGNLWFTKWVGNNRFKGFFTGYWLLADLDNTGINWLIGHRCTALTSSCM